MRKNWAPHLMHPIIPNQKTRHYVRNRRSTHRQNKRLFLSQCRKIHDGRFDINRHRGRRKHGRCVIGYEGPDIRDSPVEDPGDGGVGRAGEGEGRVVEVPNGAVVGTGASGGVGSGYELEFIGGVPLAAEKMDVVGFSGVVD